MIEPPENSPDAAAAEPKERRWKYLRGAGRQLLVTLLGIAAADLLFFDHPVGWTGGLWLILLATIVAVRWSPGALRPPGKLVLLGLGGLAASMVLQWGPLAHWLSVLGLGALVIAGRLGWRIRFGEWLAAYTSLISNMLVRPLKDLRAWTRRGGTKWNVVLRLDRIVYLWVVPIALSLFFVWLFSIANPVIELWIRRQLNQIIYLLNDLSLPRPTRLLYWFYHGIILWMLLRYRRWPRKPTVKSVVPLSDEAPLIRLFKSYSGPGVPPTNDLAGSMLVRCLTLFNIVFAIQTLLDATYLFGGRVLPAGLTHAQYAHRGAYPLIATALLAAGFVLLAFRPGASDGTDRLARRLVYLWLAQNVFLVFTAAWRLHLYVAVYTLTGLRVAAGIWMLLVAMGLLWIVVRLITDRGNAWLVRVNALTALAVVYACTFINFDGWIADYNVSHCREMRGEGPAIDIYYLRELGEEALPALQRLEGAIADPQKRELLEQTRAWAVNDLRSNLYDWRGWTVRRERLRPFIHPPVPGDPAGVKVSALGFQAAHIHQGVLK